MCLSRFLLHISQAKLQFGCLSDQSINLYTGVTLLGLLDVLQFRLVILLLSLESLVKFEISGHSVFLSHECDLRAHLISPSS